jgi:CRISPR-associated protein Csm1
MSLQVFLQAQLLGSEDFLGSTESAGDGFAELLGRCAWLSLISEVLPRALLAEMKLSRMLLGSSGGEQFLVVLTDESIANANAFLERAAEGIAAISGGLLRLVWASTENLGAWPIAAKRLEEGIERQKATPLRGHAVESDKFRPFAGQDSSAAHGYFAEFGKQIVPAAAVSWSPENPEMLSCESGTYSWPLRDQTAPAEDDGIAFPRRFAMNDQQEIAGLEEIAARAEGAQRWAILRGDVDLFDLRLKRTNTIEERLQLSVLFKEFFSGELSLLCTLPEFWRKVSILYRGGDDFAVVGAWDALVALARELQRVFERFVTQNLQSFAGLEGKSLSMALAVAPTAEASPVAIFEQAGVHLQTAKATEPGSFYLFGRTLEWKRLADAEELKNGLVRLVKEFGYDAGYIHDLASVYREAYSAQATRRNKAIRVDKPWLTYMRLSRIIPASKQRDLNALRNGLIAHLIGTKTANAKLRPSGRVGLEWARLATETQ